jgi:hypothetical protein
MSEIDTTNAQFVGWQGGEIVVMRPAARMTKQQALTHAAWLVAVADDNDEFAKYLDAVRSDE